ncbi:MAG: energy transducer TonB [Novosphingobium sp.]
MRRWTAAAALLALCVAQFAHAQDTVAAPIGGQQPKPIPVRVKVAPKLLSGGDPVYPAEALAQGHQGTVLVSLLIGTDGAIKDTQLVSSSRSAILDKAVLDSLAGAKFSPAIDAAGNPTEVRAKMPFEFRRWVSDDQSRSLATYKCAEFTLDNSWWRTAWADTPGKKPELYSMLVGLAFVMQTSPKDAGSLKKMLANSEKDWASAEKACADHPESLVVDHLKQGKVLLALASGGGA